MPASVPRTPLALVATLAATGCGWDPGAPTIAFSPAPETRDAFADAELLDPEAAAARLAGALEFLVGTPSDPAYLVLEAWLDEGRDPNWGQDELSDAAWDEIEAENRVRFRDQLAAVAAGDLAAVPRPTHARVLWERWRRTFEPVLAGEAALDDLHPYSPAEDEATPDDPAFTWADEAERFWARRYPSLRESAELYRVRCLHCHGAEGAGDGPTARFLEPAPRDLRLGLFKWARVELGKRPRREDLQRILAEGVPGTRMPAFHRLTRAEREGLVDWLRLLSVRGETERVAVALASADGALDAGHPERAYELTWQRWDEADDAYADVPEVPALAELDAARAEQGRLLFLSDRAACSTCHGEEGRGDGDAVFEVGEDGERRRRLDAWGEPSRPRDLTRAILRGGDRPADLYRRIRYGISGTIMPSAADSLTDEEVWDLVAFLLHLRAEGLGP